MTIETDEDYRAALTRLADLGHPPEDSAEDVEFLELTAAMVDYETRRHPALQQQRD
ncbi:hypothetical protein [Bosea sp. PAMC 26642]|uniref:hypothetical protein n=1 Tax=Bosea sp. (strain PAMC 26642) TaxID=1792307 RepID=UPI000A718376|nr:hypothetical protein [Bosea sp. PAMC 26642]